MSSSANHSKKKEGLIQPSIEKIKVHERKESPFGVSGSNSINKLKFVESI